MLSAFSTLKHLDLRKEALRFLNIRSRLNETRRSPIYLISWLGRSVSFNLVKEANNTLILTLFVTKCKLIDSEKLVNM